MSDRAGPAVLETHVSVLVFHDDVVFKFKKPVALPFLDFHTPEARRRACEAEVSANRRLSPDVYLGVASLSLDDRDLDHAVVMRRLPAERSLAALARARPPGLEAELARVAERLARFHAGAERSPAISAAARPDALAATWTRLLETLARFRGRGVGAAVLDELGDLALAFVAGRDALFEERIAAGAVCDGHGDLLADDVFLLDDGPRFLDCIEFDPALRHVDVAADLAFLLMDLERLGAPDLAQVLLARYEEAAGTRLPRALLHHYCAERATVRAEVACLRAEQVGEEQGGDAGASALARLALTHLRAGQVVLGVLCGLPGTGKSSVAAAMGARLGWPVLRSDEIRKELHRPGWSGSLAEVPVPERMALYTAPATARTYATMLSRAATFLGAGQSVLLDATFLDGQSRCDVEALAEATGSRLVALECWAPAAVASTRLRARIEEGTDVSGADEAVASTLARRATRSGPWPRAVPLDTVGPIDAVVDEALRRLQVQRGLLTPQDQNGSSWPEVIA